MPTRLQPREIDALLLTSEASLLRLLAAHAVAAPDDVRSYRTELRKRPEDLPSELADTLRRIAEMSDDRGYEMLTASMGPLFARDEDNSHAFAAEAWLDHRDLFNRLYSRRRFSHRGHFQEFNGREPRHLKRPDRDKMADLERWLGTAFEKRGATRHCEIRLFQHEQCLVFEVAHGRPLTARPVITTEPDGGTLEEVLEFRPREIDVVIYDNRTHRIRVCARTAFSIRAYLQGVSEVLFDEVAWFATDDIVCLQPLLAGPDALSRTPGIDRAELVSLEYSVPDEHGGRVRVISNNVFGSLAQMQLEPEPGRLVRAEIKLYFTGGGPGRRVKLRPPNRLSYDRSRDERVVQQFLEMRGFLSKGITDVRAAG
jgi:hypothetical protein